MVSIIILSYNTKNLLHNCLSALYKTLHKEEFEVIVVDNNSHDGSSEMVKKEFKKATLIENQENYGFTKGINQGAKKAKGEYLLFLNSDAKILNDPLDTVIDFFNKNSKVGVMGGKLQNADGSIQRSFGSFYNIFSISILLFGKNSLDTLRNYTSERKEVDWVSGGFMFIKTDVFKKINGFDESIFMYVEDTELCYRVKQLGYKVYYFPDIKAVHEGHGSSNRGFAIIQIYKGLLYFFKKHKSKTEYSIVKLLLQLKAIIAIVIGTFTRNTNLVETYTQALKF